MSLLRPRIDALEWDDWNLSHITKHSVTMVEIEEVIAGEAIYRTSYKNRLTATGPTSSGRMLTVVIGESPWQANHYYVFSARPASRPERRDYAEQKGDPSP